MRTLALTCLIVAAAAFRTSFAIATEPVLPWSLQPPGLQQVEYVYDDGEDDEPYVYDAGDDGETVPGKTQDDEAKGEEEVVEKDSGEKPYVYDEGEDEEEGDSTNAAAQETKNIEAAQEPMVETEEAQPVAPAPEDPANAQAISSDLHTSDSCNPCCCEEGPWSSCVDDFSLDAALGWECCPYNIGGWSEPGYTTNNVPLSQAYNDLLSFSDVPDNVNLYQQWLYLERVVDGSQGLDFGGRVDAIYGTDAQKTQAFGNPGANVRGIGFYDASWDHGIYGFAMPQLYGEMAYYDLSLKVGHFFTPLGYEVIPATGNFFFTHSYTMFNSEPFTHTGALATYTGVEGVTLYGGWTLGWDTGFDQLDGGSNFLGGFSSELSDNVTFTYMTTIGNFGWRDSGSGGSYNHSIVVIADLSDNLQYVFQSDNLRTDNPGVNAFDTIGAVNYLFYTVGEKSKLGGRIEWWKADGVSYQELTLGWNYNALTNLVLRPEWRQDWSPGADIDEDTFAIDAIWSY
ncbi:MAG: outer membrane beta-barrel protein [Pirellulales bacterium]